MGVPGEIAERRRITRRPRAAWAVVLLAATLVYFNTPLPAPIVAQPAEGDCVELHLYSNGYHSDVSAPAEIFPEHHPLRRLYPEARTFLIGWGDEAFYRSNGTDLWLGLDALVPPSPSVLHVTYNAPEVAAYLGPNDDLAIGISREGAERFVAYVDRSLVLDESGAVERVADGKVVGRSSFLRTRGSFHLFNVCNQWMARALRAAGVNVNARNAWMAKPLIRQVRAQHRPVCASSESSLSSQPRWS
jgi:uncharacterized protein (TIGR02117 family)